MRGCCLRGSVWKDECLWREGWQVVADCRRDLNRFAWLQSAGCGESCLSRRRTITSRKVGIAEVGPWWVASQHVQCVQGTPEMDVGEVEVGVVLADQALKWRWKGSLERLVQQWCFTERPIRWS